MAVTRSHTPRGLKLWVYPLPGVRNSSVGRAGPWRPRDSRTRPPHDLTLTNHVCRDPICEAGPIHRVPGGVDSEGH